MISPVSLSVKTTIPSKSSGRLLDALTDVIRPLTERMGLKADLIRLQREEVAYRVAVIAAKRARLSKKLVTPVPTKTMVRLLEAASLEEPDDDTMIRLWANLLASSAIGAQNAVYRRKREPVGPPAVSFAAVPGTTIRGTSARRNATGTTAVTGTTMPVAAWPGRSITGVDGFTDPRARSGASRNRHDEWAASVAKSGARPGRTATGAGSRIKGEVRRRARDRDAWGHGAPSCDRALHQGRHWRIYRPTIHRPGLTVAETSLFQRQAAALWIEEEHDAFVDFIATNPVAGDLVPGTGGLRKIRWGRRGIGKRGGVRVIYFYHDTEMPLYLLSIYAKSDAADLGPDEKRQLRNLIDILKQHHGRR